ncbi:MAG: hypothetical protein QXF09_02050 [Nitrososphaerota archaeon]
MVQIVEKQIVIFISLFISMIFSQVFINSIEIANKQATYNSLCSLINKIIYGIEVVSLYPNKEYSCIFSIMENVSISSNGNKIIIRNFNNKNPIIIEEELKTRLNVNYKLNAGVYLLRVKIEDNKIKVLFENISDNYAIRNN